MNKLARLPADYVISWAKSDGEPMTPSCTYWENNGVGPTSECINQAVYGLPAIVPHTFLDYSEYACADHRAWLENLETLGDV